MENLTFDRGSLEVIETREGFLKAKVTIAKPGVFPYMDGDDLKFFAKLPDDIFSKSTVDSAKGAPVVADLETQDHPQNNGEYLLVDSENYNKYVMGNISEPCVEDGKLVAYETIWDSRLIKKIKAGEMREVSIGFVCTREQSSGEFEGKYYDAMQKNIIINHLCHVDQGRAGDDVKIHVDRSIKMADTNKNGTAGAGDSTLDANKTYSYRMFDGSKDIAVSQEVHSELMTLKNAVKEFEVKVDGYEKEIEGLKLNDPSKEKDDEINSLKETVTGWKDQFDSLKNKIPEIAGAMASERAELISFAKSSDESIVVDGLSNKEIKLQVIAKGLPFAEGIKVDSMSDEVIEARFDASKELIREKANMSSMVATTDSTDLNKKKNAMQSAWEGGK